MPTNSKGQIKVIVADMKKFTENLMKALALNTTSNLREDNSGRYRLVKSQLD
jgi:hypothetical protein